MSDDPHPDDADLFRWAWIALGVGLFTLLAFGAVGAYQWYLKATVRPADDVSTVERSEQRRMAVPSTGETDMRYRILEATSHASLATLVNEAINDGWVPLGGHAVGQGSNDSFKRYSQSLTHPDLSPDGDDEDGEGKK